ncbi:hypothetical protein [Neorhizobium sp. T7_12]|uniref:hypothetical protein n=1 Tax=Neorhizobium sp. T7_12 TaxID=2093832 RepID=UPI000CF915C4|nr:hypothetical protein [Neorhizobium sp. T7_12]
MVRLAPIVFILLATGANAAPVEAPHGQSQQLPISFQVRGGAAWCNKGVTVDLKSKDAGVLTDGSEAFQQMLGRIRSGIESECPQVRNIGFYGRATKGEVAIGESLKVTDWIYVPFKVDGKRPDCEGPLNGELCNQRWRVFNDIRSLFLDGAFSQGILTRFLSTREGADAEFVSGEAKGRVAFVPTTSGVPFKTAAEFVGQQIDQTAKNCQGQVTKTQNEAFNAQTSYQSLTCQSADEAAHTHFVIFQSPDGFEITAFSDYTLSGISGQRLATELRAALGRTPVPWSDIKIIEHGDSPPTLHAGACLARADEFAGVGNRPVAIRTRSEQASLSDQFAVRIDQTGQSQTVGDTWQMRLRNLNASERKYLDNSRRFGSWLVYRAVESDRGHIFENQLFAATSPTSCEAIRSPNQVEVANLPVGIVDLYVDNLDLAKTAPKEKRQVLKQWADGEAPPRNGAVSNPTPELPDVPKYPPAIIVGWQEFRDTCLTDQGNTVAFENDFLTSVDIDNDGDLDYITNGDGILCKSANGSVLHSGGGNGAVQIMIFNTTKSGIKLAFHKLVASGFMEKHDNFAVFVNIYGEFTEYHKIRDGRSEKLPGVYLGGREIYTVDR